MTGFLNVMPAKLTLRSGGEAVMTASQGKRKREKGKTQSSERRRLAGNFWGSLGSAGETPALQDPVQRYACRPIADGVFPFSFFLFLSSRPSSLWTSRTSQRFRQHAAGCA